MKSDKATAIPVIALTGYLGAGKTSLLNHVLRMPGARVGVVINDFGDLNVDASLVTGQVDEPASIAGGCICCLPEDGGLDEALEKLSDPRLQLDAIIVEASGLAEPVAVARMIRFSGVERVRAGGVVDVIDAARYFDTVDRDDSPPARYGAASLVVINKLDQLPDAARTGTVERIKSRVRERNPDAHVVSATGARIDPALLYDVADDVDESGQLSFRQLLLDAEREARPHDHVHADSVTVTSTGCVDAGALLDFLEHPPAGVYRIKGTVAIRYRSRERAYVVNVVGTSIHVADARPGAASNSLVAIGTHINKEHTLASAAAAIQPAGGVTETAGIRRLQRYRRLSI